MTLVWESGITLQHPDNNDPLLDLNTQPSLDLQFATSKTLDDAVSGNNLITFSRASSGTYVGSDGLIKSATTDAPRFDHDPVTGESLGLLIEESRTNLLTYSEQFDDGSYITAGLQVVAPTKTPNQATAPDGSLTADKIDYPAVSQGNTYSLIYQNPVTLSGSHSSSIYLRGAVGGEKVYLFYIVDGIYSNTLCTLTTEWQRFSVNFTGGTLSYWHLGVDLRAGPGQVAQSASTIYAWGAQVEAGSFPSSYIPTTGSAVTRAADVVSIEGTNFSSWYNQSEGTVFAQYGGGRLTAFPQGLGRIAATEAWSMEHGFTPIERLFGVTSGSYNAFNGSVNADTGYPKYAIAYASSTYVAAASDGLLETSIIGSVTFSQTSSKFTVGQASNYIFQLNGHIARLAYYPYRLADATLQEITS